MPQSQLLLIHDRFTLLVNHVLHHPARWWSPSQYLEMSVCYIPDRDKILCLVSENIGADKAHWFFFPVLHVSFSLFRFSFILAAF